MKKTILIIISVILSIVFRTEEVNAQAEYVPVYTQGQYYAWAATNATIASNALNYINATGWFPITGKNAESGESQPNKTKTSKWADKIEVTTNNLYCFPRIPTKLMNYVGVPASNRVAFISAFLPMIKAKHEITLVEEEQE